ncbi:MAG: hypothetical protein JXR07_15415 [Reichenbachiella sp.]
MKFLTIVLFCFGCTEEWNLEETQELNEIAGELTTFYDNQVERDIFNFQHILTETGNRPRDAAVLEEFKKVIQEIQLRDTLDKSWFKNKFSKNRALDVEQFINSEIPFERNQSMLYKSSLKAKISKEYTLLIGASCNYYGPPYAYLWKSLSTPNLFKLGGGSSIAHVEYSVLKKDPLTIDIIDPFLQKTENKITWELIDKQELQYRYAFQE